MCDQWATVSYTDLCEQCQNYKLNHCGELSSYVCTVKHMRPRFLRDKQNHIHCEFFEEMSE